MSRLRLNRIEDRQGNLFWDSEEGLFGEVTTSTGTQTIAEALDDRERLSGSALTADIYRRMKTSPPAVGEAAIQVAIKSLETSGIIQKLDALYFFAAHSLDAALVNWAAPRGPKAEADDGCIFLPYKGLQTTTEDSINTQIIPSTDGNYSVESACAGFYTNERNAGEVGIPSYPDGTLIQGRRNSSIRPAMGLYGSGNFSLRLRPSNYTDSSFDARMSSTSTPLFVSRSYLGHFSVSRDGLSLRGYYNGKAEGESTIDESSDIPDSSLGFGCSGTAKGDYNYLAGYFGAGLSDKEVALLHSIIKTYLLAVGAVEELDIATAKDVERYTMPECKRAIPDIEIDPRRNDYPYTRSGETIGLGSDGYYYVCAPDEPPHWHDTMTGQWLGVIFNPTYTNIEPNSTLFSDGSYVKTNVNVTPRSVSTLDAEPLLGPYKDLLEGYHLEPVGAGEHKMSREYTTNEEFLYFDVVFGSSTRSLVQDASQVLIEIEKKNGSVEWVSYLCSLDQVSHATGGVVDHGLEVVNHYFRQLWLGINVGTGSGTVKATVWLLPPSDNEAPFGSASPVRSFDSGGYTTQSSYGIKLYNWQVVEFSTERQVYMRPSLISSGTPAVHNDARFEIPIEFDAGSVTVSTDFKMQGIAYRGAIFSASGGGVEHIRLRSSLDDTGLSLSMRAGGLIALPYPESPGLSDGWWTAGASLDAIRGGRVQMGTSYRQPVAVRSEVRSDLENNAVDTITVGCTLNGKEHSSMLFRGIRVFKRVIQVSEMYDELRLRNYSEIWAQSDRMIALDGTAIPAFNEPITPENPEGD